MALVVAIKKKFEKFKLDVSFEAEHGVTGLLGASGCGKSMTLKCIAGIETPDEGQIILDGRVLFDSAARVNLTPQARRVGYLFQHYALFPNMTAEQNIMSGVRSRAKSARKTKTDALIQTFYLGEQAGKYPRQLSGGQQQRVALARILASAPEVLLLDEPFSALDSYLKWQVELELMELLAAFPGAVLFVTHNRDEIYRMCGDVCVLDHGRSESRQPVHALFNAPGTRSACLLSGCKNVSRARAREGGGVDALDWGVTLTPATSPAPGLTHVGVRSHAVQIADGPGENTFYCPVLRVIEDVLSFVILLRAPAGGETARLRVERSKESWAGLAGATALWLHIEPESMLLLYGE